MSKSSDTAKWVGIGVTAVLGGAVLYLLWGPLKALLGVGQKAADLANRGIQLATTAINIGQNAISTEIAGISGTPGHLWMLISSLWGNCGWSPDVMWVSGQRSGQDVDFQKLADESYPLLLGSMSSCLATWGLAAIADRPDLTDASSLAAAWYAKALNSKVGRQELAILKGLPAYGSKAPKDTAQALYVNASHSLICSTGSAWHWDKTPGSSGYNAYLGHQIVSLLIEDIYSLTLKPLS